MTANELALKTALETYGKQIDLKIVGFDKPGAKRGQTVTITDASVRDNSLTVAASSETMEDLSSVKVTRTGKNILDWAKLSGINGEKLFAEADGKIKVECPDDSDVIYGIDLTDGLPSLKAGETYTFSIENIDHFAADCCFALMYEDGTGIYGSAGDMTLTTTIQKPIEAVHFCFFDGQETNFSENDAYFYVYGLQVENGVKTEFEQPDIMAVTLDADGTTTNLTTIAPITMLFSNTEGVILDAAYTKSVTYTGENIVSCTPSFDGSLLTAIMKQADIEIERVGGKDAAEAMKGAKIFITLTIKAGEATATKEYGTFIVKNAEYKDETNSAILTCYDLMLLAMTEYAPVVEFPATEELEEAATIDADGETKEEIEPVTLGRYLQAMCDDIGVTLATPTFPNSDVIIDGEKYDASYTKRDVFAEIAQAAGGTIAIKNDELHMLYPTATDKTIEPSNLKSIEIGELYGPVNSVVLARTPQEDNIYRKDENAEKICEIKIANNQLMDSHREDFIDGIYNALYGLTYHPHNIESYGIGILDICDLFTVETLDGKTYTALHLSWEIDITQGLVERTKATVPAATETEYKVASESDRLLNKTVLRVDKQENKIEALVLSTKGITDEQGRKIGELEKKAEQTITPEEVSIKITQAITGINSVTTSTGFTFDKDGLRIKKSGEEIENLIDNTGMYVNREAENVLTANADGVQAINLTARQYLTIGTNSRFEDYEGNRTACFYIGG